MWQKLTIFLVLLLAAAPVHAEEAQPPARHVILMVADGAGYNAWAAEEMYAGTTGRHFRRADGWVNLAVSTHPLRAKPKRPVPGSEGLLQDPEVVYDPAKAWDVAPEEGRGGAFKWYFAGYKWQRKTETDSANTATAISTGRKTYVKGINVDGNGRPIGETLARLAKRSGMQVGVVTDVPFSHATPAALGGAHAADRDHYCALAVEMLTGSDLDVIAGCGHPGYDNNGEEIEDPGRRVYRYAGGRAVWRHLTGELKLRAGDPVCEEFEGQSRPLSRADVAALNRWGLRQTRKGIEELAEGDEAGPGLLIVPRVGEIVLWNGRSGTVEHPEKKRIEPTLQQNRASRADPRFTPPGYDPPLAHVPSLETMTRVALNALDDHPRGFLLTVEGGAADWAMHDQQMGRMIEELVAFRRAVAAVVAWIERNEAWDETLLIVTADHDHLLWGPDANHTPFQPLQDNGPGKLPGYRWLYDEHSCGLVPLWARGVGAGMLRVHADRTDPVRGPYLDQTDIFQVIRQVITGRN